MSPQREHRVGAIDAPDAAADPAGQPAADVGDHRAVVAASARGVEVDQLHARKSREPCDPRLRARGFDGEPFALYELNDVALLQIDGGYKHDDSLKRQLPIPNSQLPTEPVWELAVGR